MNIKNNEDSKFLIKGIRDGLIAGATEAISMYPTVTWKNCWQLDQPVPWKNPKKMYKGFSYYASCLIPFFIIMQTVNRYFITQKKNAKNELDKLVIAGKASLTGGSIGTLILNPCEVSLVQLTKYKSSSVRDSAKKIWKIAGIRGFYRGFVAAFCRNNLYAAGINFFPHLVQGDNQYLMAPVMGLICGTLSHPADVVTTIARKEIDPKKAMSTMQLSSHIFREGGAKAFFKGFIPRSVRMGAGSLVVVSALKFFEEK